MPKVLIVEPNISQEENEKALRDIADVMEQIVEEEIGAKVKIKLVYKEHKESA